MANEALRPRVSEQLYKWGFWIIAASFGIAILLDWLTPNAWVLSVMGLALLILLFVFTRTTRPWDYGDAIAATRMRDTKLPGGRPLDPSPGNCQVKPHGSDWLVHFIKESVTFRVDPTQRRIVGREIRDPDSIIAHADRSEILRTARAPA